MLINFEKFIATNNDKGLKLAIESLGRSILEKYSIFDEEILEGIVGSCISKVLDFDALQGNLHNYLSLIIVNHCRKVRKSMAVVQ